MKLELDAAENVYRSLTSVDARVKALEGGSRSGKTWTIILYLVVYMARNQFQGKVITVARAKLTWLKATLLKDFFEICTKYQLPLTPTPNANRAEQTYYLWGNEITFIGMDEPQKLHGRKQNIAWINEAIEADYAGYSQLAIRTTEEILLDYNPAAIEHWIYDRVLTRDDAVLLKSTMLDNPFLEDAVRREILSFEPTAENIKRGTADATNWKIYGLGERAAIEGRVFENVNYVDAMPDASLRKWTAYGLDFGYSNDPTTLIEVCLSEGELYLHEHLYQRGLTNTPPLNGTGYQQTGGSIHEELQGLEIGRAEIIADSAEPKSIKELILAGWNIRGAKKGPDSIKAGIDALKRYKLNVTNASMNLRKELQNYRWAKDASGQLTGKPIDAYNHLIDAARYVALSKLMSPQRKVGFRTAR